MTNEDPHSGDPKKTEIIRHEGLPLRATMDSLIALAEQKGLEAFRGSQVIVDGSIEPDQLDRLSGVLDSELSLVKLEVGKRVIAVGLKREYAPFLQDFVHHKSKVVCHLHTHVPEADDPEVLKRGPSTTDLQSSEKTAVPLWLRVAGRTFEYKIAEKDAGRAVKKLYGEFFGNLEAKFLDAINNPSSDLHSAFYEVLKGMEVDLENTKRVEAFKRDYAEELASNAILERQSQATSAVEKAALAEFIVERMTSAEFQGKNPGSYIREISQEKFDEVFNPPTITLS